MKIIQTPARFYPYTGGVENYVLGLSKELIKQRNQVTVVCADEPKTNISEYEGIRIIRLPYIGKISNTNITLGLIRTLLSENYDVIHTYLPTPWSLDLSVLIGKLRGKKVIITYCNDLSGHNLLEEILIKIYCGFFLRILLTLVDKIIIIQQNYDKNSKYLRIYQSKIVFIPPGVDRKIFKKLNIYKVNHSIFFLSILDKYHTYKGLFGLLRAIKIVKRSIPDVKLYIGGDGSHRKNYQELVSKFDLNNCVKFLGFIPDDKLPYYYNKYSLFILPSTEIQEGFGMVAAEAMSCGVPVIVSKIVGLSSIVNNKCGIVVEPNNIHALATAIKKMLVNKKLLKKFGRNAINVICEKYSWKTVSQEVIRLYKNYLVIF